MHKLPNRYIMSAHQVIVLGSRCVAADITGPLQLTVVVIRLKRPSLT